ncbi:MAG: polyprenyl synthetase family protein [Candidatus Magnetobacterium sp. LHC-1]|uniref:Polyprenyl synthetase family protein n=1 Tax=Candidatus Magnetobacterium casense TaxID=1455061 RepID=A0ABS6RY86_9BACT|nr:farnesyl diphosphate synthase [Candidatus Magnetobacterium casensis]MBF0607285.1 polyprenyl synthetase family protein [Nitrospirota bacterium]MBV6341290.1 polyprenyl synthetase family protein [Candidatus Magnetobacterium casensis]
MELKVYLDEKKRIVENFLLEYFKNSIQPVVLDDAMKYSVFAGGKRLRPVLCMAAYEACGGNGQDILPQAGALELIHTYSLIHDDLPAMDDDDLRRGKPTNHKVYGEAIAILAGDGLLTEAFHMFSHSTMVSDSALLAAIRELSAAAGLYGMVAGQAMDIISEGKVPQIDTLEFIHRNKTAALIRASLMIGGILAEADEQTLQAFRRYGEGIGLAFQVVDDILDVTGTTEELGKTKGADDSRDKMTYPALYGIERSKIIAEDLITAALEAIQPMAEKAGRLREIATYLTRRTN